MTENNGVYGRALRHRTFLIPYMGDISHVLAASMRHFGIDSRALPTATETAFQMADKHVYTETCFPLKGVVGDALSFLDEERRRLGRAAVEDRYLVALPTTCGPCRFGKYGEVLRQFMDKEGFEKVPVAGPSTETNYTDLLGEGYSLRDKMRFYHLIMKAILASDLLDDILLRYRPYAGDRAAANRLKEQCLDGLVAVIEAGGDMGRLRQWAASTLAAFRPYDGGRRFPLVLYSGEIYMRKHDPYTAHVIERLEEKGLEMIRPPVMEWIEYINQNNIDVMRRTWKWAVRGGQFGRAARTLLRLMFYRSNYRKIRDTKKKLTGQVAAALSDRHVLPEAGELIRELEKDGEFDGRITGEAPLSIGLAYFLMNDRVRSRNGARLSGMFHVGPFTCMQEGVAAAKIDSLASDLRRRNPEAMFPVLHGFFGDSPNPNLEAEIAVFSEQCYQKRDLLLQGR
jgi:predicted nucleotide-binding protein (sugar kinase/HSP70/actin superfamily)